MYKVLLVEDEEIIRCGIRNSIPWAEFGCCVAGEAGNGEEGARQIEELRPDIVITDINMPVMDGLAMLAATKLKYDYAAVILTGYSEFEYARKALKLGVCEYLLKPFSKEELGKVMMKLKETILKKKEEEKQNLYHRKVTLEEMLNKTMQLEAEDREELLEYRERLMQLGISLDAPYYEVSITELEKLGEKEIPKEDI